MSRLLPILFSEFHHSNKLLIQRDCFSSDDASKVGKPHNTADINFTFILHSGPMSGSKTLCATRRFTQKRHACFHDRVSDHVGRCEARPTPPLLIAGRNP